ncbi:MAG: cytochrome c biogenesis protein CcdA [Planctomycetota bacterium]|nr:cytochrome c biogenesis protein CcdA [Planctomycetota bacterium]
MLASLLLTVLTLAGPADESPLSGLNRSIFPPQPPAQTQYYDSRDRVHVEAIADSTRAVPGEDLILAVIFKHDPGWHVHTNDPVVPPELGDPSDYYKTELFFEPADGPIRAHPRFIQWPEPHEIKVAFTGSPIPYEVFEGTAVAYVPITIAPDAPLGQASLTVKPVFQVCDDSTCLAPTPMPSDGSSWDDYEGLKVPIEIVSLETMQANPTPPPDPAIFGGFNQAVFSEINTDAEYVDFDTFGVEFSLDTASTWGLILFLIVAAIGGLLLNFTPCVLPVIPLKIMALSAGATHRSRTILLGIAMAIGIVAFWLGLGVAIKVFTEFTATNQLFQYPAFTISVGVLIAILAVGMCGLFTLRLPGKLYMFNPSHDTIWGSFLFGIMTAILSTPCTAPFMGAAMAWAAGEPFMTAFVTFAAVGIGMALPYLFLSIFPKLTEKMPKAGPASELIKQVMGLLMLAAAAYFIGVGLSGMLVTPPEPPSRLYLWVVAGVIMLSAAWLIIRTFQITKLLRNRVVFGGIGLLLLAASILGGLMLTEKGPINWVYYTPQRFVEAKEEGNIVVMEFTAEWCLNCKALEQSVLASDTVAKLLSEPGVVPMKVDLTGNNDEGNDMLAEVGGLRIPLLIVFKPDGQIVFEGDFYTVDQVVEAVDDARGSS